MKLEVVKRVDARSRPYCHGPDFCTCHSGYMEPDDYCPFHGGVSENRCVKCGRFFSRENPKTCNAYEQVEGEDE